MDEFRKSRALLSIAGVSFGLLSFSTTVWATDTLSQVAERPFQIAQADQTCRDCGFVESVRSVKQEGQGSGLGAIAGGLIGGLLGNQVGGGHGREVATVAGAVAGGYAGHTIEKNRSASEGYEVVVRFDDGSSRVFTQSSAPSWQTGQRVQVVNGQIIPR